MVETGLLIHRISHERPLLAHQLVPFTQLGDGNYLIGSALPLLLLLTQLRQRPYMTVEHVNTLKDEIVQELYAFTERAQVFQCPLRLILTARYGLCAALDEVVLLSSGGQQSDWSHQSLLSLFHHEAWGGARFFDILDETVATPGKNLLLLEFLYLILSLGFEGRYDKQLSIRDEIQNRLYHLIRQQKDASVGLRKTANNKRGLIHYFLGKWGGYW